MSNINLFLDDERNPGSVTWVNGLDYKSKEWVIVRTGEAFVRHIIRNGLPELISFDHDLGLDDNIPYNNGYQCAKWLAYYCWDNRLDLPDWFVHSMNPVGKENIVSILKQFVKHSSN